MESLKDKLATKDLEIELINQEIRTAYSIIDQQQHKIVTLEKRTERDDRESELEPDPETMLNNLLTPNNTQQQRLHERISVIERQQARDIQASQVSRSTYSQHSTTRRWL
ncbi:hypothetical protein Pcinc_007712 [Petrolisthes cinctipes]|uniref:Uncharacterized protein n=1 Tax=Petrolisthes cinctipes TaxID=88211 RepID=A0AAE1GAG2_PETCI|nr:hypothetical protein Pcinc_007712 [Petrolisthes cinctipes]